MSNDMVYKFEYEQKLFVPDLPKVAGYFPPLPLVGVQEQENHYLQDTHQ